MKPGLLLTVTLYLSSHPMITDKQSKVLEIDADLRTAGPSTSNTDDDKSKSKSSRKRKLGPPAQGSDSEGEVETKSTSKDVNSKKTAKSKLSSKLAAAVKAIPFTNISAASSRKDIEGFIRGEGVCPHTPGHDILAERGENCKDGRGAVQGGQGQTQVGQDDRQQGYSGVPVAD